MDRSLDTVHRANDAVAHDLGENVRLVTQRRIMAIRQGRRLTPAQKRSAILDAEAKVHDAVIRALAWALQRSAYHANAAVTPGSRATEEADTPAGGGSSNISGEEEGG